MKFIKKIKLKTIKILFALMAFLCVCVLILSYLYPKKTLFAAQTLSSLNGRQYASDPVDDSTTLDLSFRAFDISAEYFGLFMATDTRVIQEGTIHYDLVEDGSRISVASGDLSLSGVGNNSFLLLPLSVHESLEGEYHLLLTFSDIDPSNPPAFWITTEKYEDLASSRDEKEIDGNVIAILYNYTTSRPLVWDCIFTLCILGTIFVLLPKNSTANKEGK